MTDKYPCKKCKIKKAYAKMDFHWLDHEDCPYVCPFVKEKEKDNVKEFTEGKADE